MDYREVLKSSKSIIVKVGTSTITYPNGRLNLKRIGELALVLTDIKNRGIKAALVTSGAIGVGSVRLGFTKRPELMPQKQAAAAVGQAVLMQIYQSFFNEYNQKIAQILLTKEDMREGERIDNIVNTFNTLWDMDVIPIINANDTISTVEIGFSDNDSLAAHLSVLLEADTLVLFTDIDGMYDSDPRVSKDAKRISVVPKITEAIMSMAGGSGSSFSVGGMQAKLSAAEHCMESGVNMVIAHGEAPKLLYNILDGEDIGTLFVGK